MKSLLITFLLLPSFCFASEIYIGYLPDSSLRAQPSGITSARYVAGVQIDKPIGIFTPRGKIETLMDRPNADVSFHPASVRYEVGVEAKIIDGWYADLSRNCWHTIDGTGTEDYWMVKTGVRW